MDCLHWGLGMPSRPRRVVSFVDRDAMQSPRRRRAFTSGADSSPEARRAGCLQIVAHRARAPKLPCSPGPPSNQDALLLYADGVAYTVGPYWFEGCPACLLLACPCV